jgi:hypothetical protein
MTALRIAFTVAVVTVPCVHAQDVVGQTAADTSGAYADQGAAVLLARARDARIRTDRSLVSYTAIVRSRVAAGLRTPLKDRTLFRQEESARVRWSRDGDHIVQQLAARSQTPAGVTTPDGLGFATESLFDPSHDRLYFGMTRVDDDRSGDDEFWIEHPLGADAERHYRFRSGDTMTVMLQGGHAVRVVELRIMPRRNDPHTVRGTLWIDTRTGALVRSAFRLARVVDILRDIDHGEEDDDDLRIAAKIPLINPMQFDISLMTVEYALWELEHWLPRAMRFDGMVRLGVFRLPGSADISYQMLDVEVDAPDGVPRSPEAETELVQRTIDAWRGTDELKESRTTGHRRRYRVLRPTDPTRLLEDATLPPPIWVDAPGFATESELREMYDRVAASQGPVHPSPPLRLGWGLGEPDMFRYNRVEALSVGARLAIPLPHVAATVVGRIGVGDMHPNVELALTRETMHRTLGLRGYHVLTTVDDGGHALGLGNSLSSLLLGRDEGEYFRASGAALTLAPPGSRRRSWQARIHVERHDAVERNTHVAVPRLWTDSVFRPNIAADQATQYGITLTGRPWWGSDPLHAQFGIDAMLQAEAGDFEHVRGRITLRGAVPIGGRTRIGAELGAGTTEGSAPVQRNFFLGGASTLRGYEPGTGSGTSMARGRIELARTYPFANLAVFSDWGWAGDRDDIRRHQQRWAVGAGGSLFDGLIRLDLAHALRAPRGWRIDLHLDSLL